MKDAVYIHSVQRMRKDDDIVIIRAHGETKETFESDLMGLSLKNISISLKRNGKEVYSDVVERMLLQPAEAVGGVSIPATIVEKLAKEGKTKEGIGRDEFDKEAWAWYDQYGNAGDR